MSAIARAEDILLVVSSLCIQFHTRQRLIGKSFCQLPTPELVYRLVFTVGQHHCLGILFCGILPSVITLHLKIGL